MKRAVIINGVSAPVDGRHFMMEWLQKNGFRVQTVEPMRGETIGVVKEEPEVIIAWSLGGFLAPKLAEKFPKAKLILVATSARAAPDGKMARLFYEAVKRDFGQKLLYWGLRLPKKWLVGGYQKILKTEEGGGQRWVTLMDNVMFFRKLSKERIREVVGIIISTDNRELLRRLKNKTLIFGGENDTFMPVKLEKEMNGLVEGSKLVITEGGHFNAVDEKYLGEIGKFLGVK
jgi:pimeloyl-ACP methyl ester carboxylesterase